MSEVQKLEVTTPMMEFIKETAEKEGYVACEVRCSVEELPQRLRDLLNAGARVMVGSMGTVDERWTTEWMNQRGFVWDFQQAFNQEEKEKSSCVPVAMRNLGFSVTPNKLDKVAKSYDKSLKPEQKQWGHAMTVSLRDDDFVLTDQHGAGTVNSDTIINMAKFKSDRDMNLSQGYFFVPEAVSKTS